MIVQINDVDAHHLALTVLAFFAGLMIGYTFCLGMCWLERKPQK
jgi:hypothetical protein